MSINYYTADRMARDILHTRRAEAKQHRNWVEALKAVRKLAKQRNSDG